jgi:hypothetical protein
MFPFLRPKPNTEKPVPGLARYLKDDLPPMKEDESIADWIARIEEEEDDPRTSRR